MRVALTVFAFLLGLLCFFCEGDGQGIEDGQDAEHPVVETIHGKVRGSRMKSWTSQHFYAFRGIRFAKPPLGQLRFKAPVAPEAWAGIADATKDRSSCVQPIGDFYGDPSEDCLFINVYTKKLRGKVPVIVFFHAGGWFSQTARSDTLGPHYLVDKDVVVVTANYRLGALGFLSTGDEHAVGNYGMKDQVMALRWVRDNIGEFGGDPGMVTIAGYSVGSTSVVLHMLSPMSKGLFNRAVGMSAGVTAQWVINDNQLQVARKLGRLAACNASTTQLLVECLRNVPAQTLADFYPQMREWASDPAMVYGLAIEKETSDGERFLTGRPTELIRAKKFHQVPTVLGITGKEFQPRADAIIKNDTLRYELNHDFERIGPIAFYYEKDSEKSKMISSQIRKFYLKNREITKDSEEVGMIYSDSTIIFDTETTAKLLAEYSSAPVYFYMSNYVGRSSFFDLSGTKMPKGVAHMDDLNYMFFLSKYFPKMFKPSEPESEAVDAYTSILANMAKTGDPTPITKSDFKWQSMTTQNLMYMDIDKINNSLVVSMKHGLPYSERMEFWEAIYPTFITEDANKTIQESV